MIKITLLLFITLFFSACANKHGISAKYYSDCEEYYDVQGYYHKECGKDDIVSYKAIGDSVKSVVDDLVGDKEASPEPQESGVW